MYCALLGMLCVLCPVWDVLFLVLRLACILCFVWHTLCITFCGACSVYCALFSMLCVMCSGVFCDPVYVLLEMVHLECVGQWWTASIHNLAGTVGGTFCQLYIFFPSFFCSGRHLPSSVPFFFFFSSAGITGWGFISFINASVSGDTCQHHGS